ncbi:L,D-transpeptidase family protein [Streptomyces apocyni]|uniref:L,D-transpeptidase family protein n=1 Tax=Streptomyces apocyni TaxID=2654677 RepID=UPI0012EA3802|nr:L,D-transpeptidase family protein [Streptomyces apocyni]
MRISGTVRSVIAALACGVALTSCGGVASGGSDGGTERSGPSPRTTPATPNTEPTPKPTPKPTPEQRTTDLTRIPDVGDRLHQRIPDRSRQVLAVYGEGENSADATAVLYTKHGSTWDLTRSWPAHNGKKGWTPDHREDDNRSPVGVFTLTDAGGVLDAPGARLPYTRSPAFAAPRSWPKTHWYDFDLVIAIDYNRVKGTPPNDPTRPEGQSKGGSIWLHLDHGSGTSGCVSLAKPAMEYLLRTLDPGQHPVVVMGDKAHLRKG